MKQMMVSIELGLGLHQLRTPLPQLGWSWRNKIIDLLNQIIY